MGLLPVVELAPAGRGEGDAGGAAVAGVGLAVDEAGLQELADQPADGVGGEPLAVGQFADPERGGGEALEEFDLRHRQGLHG